MDMKWSIIIPSVISLIITSAFCQDPEVVVEDLTDDRVTLSWKPLDAKNIIVQAQEGYQIQVDTTQFDVNGENDDYVLVKSVTEDGEDGDALMFTYTVGGKPSYLYNTNRVQATYNGVTETNSFLIQFTRVGEATTTTPEAETTPTTPAMPTPSPEETNTLTVYLYGRPASDFKTDTKTTDALRSALAAMGTAYCDVQGCPLNGSITINNAKIVVLEQCPMLWENYENCINLTFSLPIVKLDNYEDENNLWSGYQLNEGHLSAMWYSYAEKFIKEMEMGLNIYTVPDVTIMMRNRIIAMCSVIVALVILILILRHVLRRQSERGKHSDTFSIMSQQSNRDSRLSLTPHYLQELPPLFPMYSDQIPHKPFSDYKNNNFADDIDPSTLPTASNMLDISNNDPDEPEEVFA